LLIGAPENDSQNQCGDGSFDLIPPVPTAIELHVEQPPEFSITNQKSTQFDKFDAERLINNTPQRFHRRAQMLLEKIKQDPLSIDFNAKGELFIDSVSIPDANIFEIFPQLFDRKKKKLIPGLFELAAKISFLNYGYLISPGITKGLKRPKNYEMHKDTTTSLKELKKWWYMSA